MMLNSLRCSLFVIKVVISSSICLFNLHYIGIAKLPKKSEQKQVITKRSHKLVS